VDLYTYKESAKCDKFAVDLYICKESAPYFCRQLTVFLALYRIRIQAVNTIGVGPFSAPVRVTTRPLPPNPSKLECVTPAPNSLKLKWGDQRGLDTNHYTLEMEKEDGK
jgi:hypothetical protein